MTDLVKRVIGPLAVARDDPAMTKLAHLLEALGFSIAAGATAAAFAIRSDAEIAPWLALAAALAAGPLWFALIARDGEVHYGLAALTGGVATVGAYLLAAAMAALFLIEAIPFEQLWAGTLGFAFFALLLTGMITVPLGAGAALLYAVVTRLWRR